MTVLAAAALAAGIYHYRRYRGPARAAPRPHAADDDVAARVRAAIGRGPIDVRVANGVVTLRGAADRAQRDRAVAAALSVRGVRQVASQLELTDDAPGMERGSMRAGMTQPPEPGEAKRADPDLETRPGFSGGQ